MRTTMKMLALALMVAMLCSCLNVVAEGDVVANVLEFIVEEPVAETPAEETEVEETEETETDLTEEPEVEETEEPVVEPEVEETEEPVVEPEVEETEEPAVEPEVEETEEPVVEPEVEETEEPVVEPEVTEEPEVIEPTEEPAAEPTPAPTAKPTKKPAPTAEPTPVPVTALGDADVRLEADGMSEIFVTIPDGAELNILAVEGDWVKVEVDGEIGYIYIDSVAGLVLPEPETTPDPEADEEPEFKVTIFSSRRTVMAPGETVTLSCKLEGFEGYTVSYQWQYDRGNGFEDVPEATGETYSFEATVEMLAYDWSLLVYYE